MKKYQVPSGGGDFFDSHCTYYSIHQLWMNILYYHCVCVRAAWGVTQSVVCATVLARRSALNVFTCGRTRNVCQTALSITTTTLQATSVVLAIHTVIAVLGRLLPIASPANNSNWSTALPPSTVKTPVRYWPQYAGFQTLWTTVHVCIGFRPQYTEIIYYALKSVGMELVRLE